MKKTMLLMALLCRSPLVHKRKKALPSADWAGRRSALPSPVDPVQGAVVGGAVGAVAGALIGRANERGECRYRDSRGRVYIDRCPDGY